MTTGVSKYRYSPSYSLFMLIVELWTVDSAASMGLEFKLRRFLEKFRVRMRNGIPELGIPPLEPFTLDEIDIDTDNPEIGK